MGAPPQAGAHPSVPAVAHGRRRHRALCPAGPPGLCPAPQIARSSSCQPNTNQPCFRSLADGIAIPYGIYDVLANTGTIVVGTSHDTPYFAVDCLAFWWRTVGRLRYPAATQLTVLADCGGSNGYRPRAWKHGLQYRFCNPHGLSVRVVHYPPGQSKYNPIEHRLFSEISKNWAGCPLVSYETILNYIATTNTVTGLVVGSHFVNDDYPTGIKITKEQVDALNLARHASLPAWNYTISPMAN